MAGSTDAPAVAIRELTKHYSGSDCAAVDGLDLEVAEAETVGLLGPNGAGKTTTIGVCTTRVRPTSGRVVVAGWDVASDGLRVRRDVGVVTQQNTLDRSCTVIENLYYHCRFFGMGRSESRERAASLLRQFSLSSRGALKPAWLSGGMVQRLQIARAMAHRPRVLFLDEPTAGLDPQSRLAVWDQLAQLTTDGTTVFLTTHHMEEADRLCDRVAIVDGGRVLVCGSPAELKRAAGDTRVTLTVARPAPGLAATLRRLPGVTGVESLPSGYRISTTGGSASLSRIVPAAIDAGITDLAVAEPSLEDVFISLTGKELRD